MGGKAGEQSFKTDQGHPLRMEPSREHISDVYLRATQTCWPIEILFLLEILLLSFKSSFSLHLPLISSGSFSDSFTELLFFRFGYVLMLMVFETQFSTLSSSHSIYVPKAISSITIDLISIHMLVTPQRFDFKLDLPTELFTPLCRDTKSPSSTCPNVNSFPHLLQTMLLLHFNKYHLPKPEILVSHWLLFSYIPVIPNVKLSSLHSHCHHTHSKHHHIAPEQFQELISHLWFHPIKSSFILQSLKIKCGVGHISLDKTLQWCFHCTHVHVH